MEAPFQTLSERGCEAPPILVRMAAFQRRRGHYGSKLKRKLMAELIAQSGLPRRTFQRIAYSQSWDKIPFASVSKFAAACGVDLLRKNPVKDVKELIVKHGLNHLTTRQRRKADAVVRAMKGVKA